MAERQDRISEDELPCLLALLSVEDLRPTLEDVAEALDIPVNRAKEALSQVRREATKSSSPTTKMPVSRPPRQNAFKPIGTDSPDLVFAIGKVVLSVIAILSLPLFISIGQIVVSAFSKGP